MAHALTTVRLLLVIPTGLLFASEDERAPILAAVALAIAIATDLLDGPVARRLGSASTLGTAFDHSTDCLFVVSGMAGAAVRGTVPWTLPVVVTVAFVQYAIDAFWLHRPRLPRGIPLGRYNGILYFAPLCGDTLVRLGVDVLRPAVPVVCWILILSTLLSIGQRLLPLMRTSQTAPALPAEGTEDQSPH